MNVVLEFTNNLIALMNDASPWLLLGLLIAGLMKTWLPKNLLSKHLGKGKTAVIKAALIGAPLPLCSCGVIPVASELRRNGASKAATSSFLVATPETGVDSITVSYALLGPFIAVYRPITAIMSAITTGVLVATIKESSSKESKIDFEKKQPPVKQSSCCASSHVPSPEKTKEKTSCCASSTEKPPIDIIEKTSTCCDSTSTQSQTNTQGTLYQKTLAGIKYAATQLIDDIIVWLFIGLIFAAIVQTFIPASFLLQYGSGLPAMLMMILISIPMYICATASTPIAAGFMMAGLSPGTALVFMMAGPATNISTLGVIKKEMGGEVLVRYLIGIASCAISFGLLLDYLVEAFNISVTQQMNHSHEILPIEIGILSSLVLVILGFKPLRRFFL